MIDSEYPYLGTENGKTDIFPRKILQGRCEKHLVE